MADGRIMLDTRVITSGAEKDLKRLQDDAKATTKEIAKVDSQLSKEKGNNLKLAQQLQDAKAAAEATAAELDKVSSKLDELKAKRTAELAETQGYKGLPQNTLQLVAQREVEAQNPTLVDQSDKLSGQYGKQLDAIDKAQAAYNASSASVAELTAKQADLQGVLGETNGKISGTSAKMTAITAAINLFNTGISATKSAVSTLWRGLKNVHSRLTTAPKLLTTIWRRISRIAMSAVLFQGISAALRSFMSGLKNALNQSSAFTTAMSNLKGAALNAAAPIVSALAPALTTIANLAAVALSYIAKLFAFLSGKGTASLKATAKAMGGVSSGAEKAKKSLAGFDTINVLDTSSSSGGSGSSSTSEPNYDFTASNDMLESMLRSIKEGNWAGAGKILADKLNEMVLSFEANDWGTKLGEKLEKGISFGFAFLKTFSWGTLGQKLAGIINGVVIQLNGNEIGALFAAPFSTIIDVVGNLLAELEWKDIGKKIGNFAQGFLDELTRAFQDVEWDKIVQGVLDMLGSIEWGTVIKSLINLIGEALPAAMPILGVLIGANMLNTLKPVIVTKLGELFTSLGTTILPKLGTMLTSLRTTILPKLGTMLTSLGTTILSGLSKLLTLIVSTIGTWPAVILGLVVLFIAAIAVFGDQILAKINEFGAWFSEVLTTDWSETFGVLGSLLNGFLGVVGGIITGVKDIFVGIIDFIRGVFTGDWERAWNGVKEIFGGIFETLKAVALAPINAVIALINGLIDNINSVIDFANRLKITSPFSGKTYGFNINKVEHIPYLAQGAVIPANHEFMAVLGDQTSGTNIEAPAGLIKQMVAEALAEQGGSDVTIKFTGDLAQLARVLNPVIEKEQHRRGAKLVTGVV